MLTKPIRIAAIGSADVTGAGCVQLGNILKPFLLEIFVERHFIKVYLIICEALHSRPSSGVFCDV